MIESILSEAYDTKLKKVLQSDQVPRGLRKDSRFVALPDYYQIREYDLMKEFTDAISPDKRSALEAALGGVGPFRTFRQKVKTLNIEREWLDFRQEKFMDLAAEWWDRNIATTPASAPQPVPVVAQSPDDGHAEETPVASTEDAALGGEESRLIVDPATLNGVAIIETIRVLFRRVGPTDFEEALDKLRDCLCSTQSKSGTRGEE